MTRSTEFEAVEIEPKPIAESTTMTTLRHLRNEASTREGFKLRVAGDEERDGRGERSFIQFIR